MKIYAFNGSPRKKCNTAQMLQAFVDGVKEANPDAEVEVVNLYDYTYTGCKSCFACHMKAHQDHLCCQIKDSIHDILEGAFYADGLLFASPIYFFDITAQLRAFLERLMYPGNSDKIVPTAFIYTMNATEELKEKFHFEDALNTSKTFLESTFHEAPECIYAYNTFQYNDKEIFTDHFRRNVQAKKEHQTKQFPTDLCSAHDAGIRLVERIRKVQEAHA